MVQKTINFGLILFLAVQSLAQDSYQTDHFESPMIPLRVDSEEKTKPEVYPVTVFADRRLINCQTTETLRKNRLDLRVTHRFGDVGVGYEGLFGLDNIDNVRIGLDFGLTDWWMIGFGRSKTNQHLDFNTKLRVLQQGPFPVAVSWYSEMAITPRKDPHGDFSKFVHRFSYAHQLIVGRKFGERISLQIMPAVQHRNIVPTRTNLNNGAAEENTIFACGVAGKIQITKMIAFVGEYHYVFSDYRTNNTENPFYSPLSLGVELYTGGHLFQINFSNSAGIIANDYLPYTQSNWLDGGFKYGFNISRVFKF